MGRIGVSQNHAYGFGHGVLAARKHELMHMPFGRGIRAGRRAGSRLCRRASRRRGLAHARGNLLQGAGYGGKGGANALRAACVVGNTGWRARRRVLASGIGGHIVLGALVLARQHAPGVDHVHQALAHGVDDGQVEACGKGRCQEGRIDQRTEGQPKADVGYSQHAAHAGQLALYERDAVENGARGALVGGGCHGKAVDGNVLPGNAQLIACVHNALRHIKASLRRGGDALLVEGEAHDGAAVVLGNGQHRLKRLALSVHRVDDGLAGVQPHGILDGKGVRGVNLQRERGDSLQLAHKAHQGCALVNLGQACVDVQNLRTCPRLVDGLAQHIVVVARAQCLLEELLARGVDALANDAHVPSRNGGEVLGTRDGKVRADGAWGGRATL